jgi:hypothetical protein
MTCTFVLWGRVRIIGLAAYALPFGAFAAGLTGRYTGTTPDEVLKNFGKRLDLKHGRLNC